MSKYPNHNSAQNASCRGYQHPDIFNLISWAWGQDNLSPGEKFILLALVKHSGVDMDGNVAEVWPNLITLKGMTGMSVSGIHKCIDGLEEKGVVFRTDRTKKKGRFYQPNVKFEQNGNFHSVEVRTSTQWKSHKKNNTNELSKDENTKTYFPQPVASAPRRGDDKMKEILFDEGKEFLGQKSGGLFAKLLQKSGQDVYAVYQLLKDAKKERPADPASWMMARVTPFQADEDEHTKFKNKLRKELGL